MKQKKQLEVLITSGGTISRIDDVRHVGNFSSGTTGMQIAEAFLKAGHKVIYVYGKGSKRPFRERMKLNPSMRFDEEVDRLRRVYIEYYDNKDRLEEYRIETFQDYYDSLESLLKNRKIDVAVLAAAVSDYSATRQEGKISSDLDEMAIKMVRNPKVISKVKEWNPNLYLVGFKLLANVPKDELLRVAQEANRKNNADLTVANSIYPGKFVRKDLYFVSGNNVEQVSEFKLAEKLVEEVEKRHKR
jgi:phosphopantothenate-cysteine ligase